MKKFGLYIIAGAFAIAIAVPAAIATNSMSQGGLFVECFEACDTAETTYAALQSE